MRNEFLVFSFLSLGFTLLGAYFFWPPLIWLLLALLPFIGLGFYDMVQTQHTVMRNFPVFGRGRYVLEELRPKLYQYFIESDTNGRPINRIYRSVVYQRAKKVRDTTPFVRKGTCFTQVKD